MRAKIGSVLNENIKKNPLWRLSRSKNEVMSEDEYWSSNKRVVDYGADQNISFFKKTEEEFNLRNIPKNSPLNRLDSDIDGITSPFVYIGRPGSTFSWHIEDHALFSGIYILF